MKKSPLNGTFEAVADTTSSSVPGLPPGPSAGQKVRSKSTLVSAPLLARQTDS